MFPQNNFLDYYVAYLRDLPECIALVHVVALKEVSLLCTPDHPLARSPRTRLGWGTGPGRGSAGEGSGCSLPQEYCLLSLSPHSTNPVAVGTLILAIQGKKQLWRGAPHWGTEG